MHWIRKRNSIAIGLAISVIALAGCSRDKTAQEVAAMNTSNIQRVANLYSAFQNYKGGRGPGSEAEFKQFIKEFDAGKLEMMGVKSSDLDGLFTSERDKKPFKVRYNVGGGRGAVVPVAFEQDGKDGKRQVGFAGNNKVEDVDEATYQQLWAGKVGGETVAAAPKGGNRPTGAPQGAPVGPPK